MKLQGEAAAGREGNMRHYYKNRKKCMARMKPHSKAWKRKHALHCRYYQFKIKYGLSKEMYDTMYLEQLGLCAICHEPFGDKSPVVDHCHKTSKVRGLVHRLCNGMIGYARDNPAILEFGAEYLRKHK